MKNKKLILAIGRYFITVPDATIRSCAAAFNISKTNIHKLIHEELRWEDEQLYQAVFSKLKVNRVLAAIRGGNATRIKEYQKVQRRYLPFETDRLYQK